MVGYSMELQRIRQAVEGIRIEAVDHLLNPPFFCWCNVFESVDKIRVWLIDKLEVR